MVKKLRGMTIVISDYVNVWFSRTDRARLAELSQHVNIPLENLVREYAMCFALREAQHVIVQRYAQGHDVENLIHMFGLPKAGIPRSMKVRLNHYAKNGVHRRRVR